MNVHYNDYTDEFESDYSWCIRIEDNHHDENTPHYILEVGSHPADQLPDSSKRKVRVPYCDNHSVMRNDSENTGERSVIEQARGRFTVTVWSDYHYDMQKTAVKVARAYIEAMQKTLPDYFVLIDENHLLW